MHFPSRWKWRGSVAKQPSSNIDLSNTPVYYADQAAGMLLGANVCRLTFGIQSEDDRSEYPRPTVTVAIQTTALMELVSDLKHIFESDAFKKDMSNQLHAAIERISRGISGSPSDAIKDVLIESHRPTTLIENDAAKAKPQKKKTSS